jgi:nitrogen regulatory protein P-II 1
MFEKVENLLQQIGVGGITVSNVEGYGERANFFKKDWMVAHVRIDIFTEAAKAEEIAGAIMQVACTGSPGDGIVAVLPVEAVYHIDARGETPADDA